ncbi:sulfur oxidation c-type cytochrome SoxX [Yoonia sediminilitoris]|uniref:Sulfur-oxidizing protein SoxX n=1 Tax=Yoonia sediminilitoris TaxID=1286148 RepID=A0A2T6KQT7_9RHOB|nr:sulfur oxidation c-type cytochrome SoxX [Yoonia sediminilitoris]PUB18918.1 sulfur-oxidizing protein SoxX [Yoonia sediminilitoris]RCW99086.1 sulfur-oxidizing protein SoxX [Yoonia sediminilitoris]
MKRLMLAGTFSALATVVTAGDVAPDDVVYGEYGDVTASLSGVAGDPAAGKEIMVARGKGNCIACHQVTALEEYPFHGEVGPSLDGVGEYRTAEELRGILANPKMTYEGTIMPAFYRVSGFTRPGDAFTGKAAEGPLSPLLTAQEIEDVVAYLQTLTD